MMMTQWICLRFAFACTPCGSLIKDHFFASNCDDDKDHCDDYRHNYDDHNDDDVVKVPVPPLYAMGE